MSIVAIAVVIGVVAIVLHGLPRDGATGSGQVLRVGVTSGPHAQILEVVARVAAKKGVAVKVVEFSDYVQPNAALADGSLDANSFQHQPYLDRQNRDRGYHFASVGLTVTFPIAAYSKRWERLEDVPPKPVIAIPNDPSNGARALKLLEHAGIVTLPKEKGLDVSSRDVVWTKIEGSIKELDAALLPRPLQDVDIAVINTNYALVAGLDPQRSLTREEAVSPYANVIAVRSGDTQREEIRALVDAYHSEEVRAFVEATFKGAVVPAW